jgi:hypothetical protein|tara:strand:+ start:422 stop:670 length:249 start_codon:yes stop_codon:yes gene_type:complete
MSDKRIIYKRKNGVVSIIVPAPDALQSMTVEEIAKKDVPTNYKYKIVDVSEISSDRTFRDAWIIDESELTDGTGENHGILEE